MQALTSDVFRSAAELDPHLEEWDELAEQESQPLAVPAWAMAWWCHLRPENSTLHVVLCWRGDRLAGVVPLFSVGRRYLPLARGVAAAEPLAHDGLQRQVAEQAAIRLAEATPAPAAIELDLHESSPSWAELLCDAWPGDGRAKPRVKLKTPVPRADLGDGFDTWMGAKSKGFRREMKRKRRRLEKAGCSFRYATPETLPGDIDAFLRLHRRRQAEQGGTSLGDGVEPMLLAAGAELLGSDRLRVLCTMVGERRIAVEVMLVSGRQVVFWNSGFDEDFARLSPGTQGMLRAISDASDEGRHKISFGPGGQGYKYRFSDEEDTMTTYVVMPPGAGLLAWARLIAERLRHRMGRCVPDAIKRRLPI